jgi:hypothetical protein
MMQSDAYQKHFKILPTIHEENIDVVACNDDTPESCDTVMDTIASSLSYSVTSSITMEENDDNWECNWKIDLSAEEFCDNSYFEYYHDIGNHRFEFADEFDDDDRCVTKSGLIQSSYPMCCTHRIWKRLMFSI